MTWRSFVDFWLMRELGHEDTILRNYDVTRLAGLKTDKEDSAVLRLALRRAGIYSGNSDAANYVPEVAARLDALGLRYISLTQIRVRLIAWFYWDRLRAGEVSTWFKNELLR